MKQRGEFFQAAPRKALSTKERLRLFMLHGGVCHICGGKIDATREAWDISHETPLGMGGADDDANRKPAHRKCHRAITPKDQSDIARSQRLEAKHMGAKAPSRRPLPGSRRSGLKRKIDGTVVRRET